MIDHDRLFKQLLTTFFLEFLQLFLPELYALLDKDAEMVAMDKELFTDITAGETHEADLVMKVKLLGEASFILIHLENQAKPQLQFGKRMFHYFARIHAKYDLPVYPIVIFSYDSPQRPEPQSYVVAFPNKTVLQFEYTVIQLNQLSWRDFVDNPNPVACALMAKMKMEPSDRPKVKAQCLRLLLTLKLNPAKMTLISGFVDTYLKLNREEKLIFDEEVIKFNPEEKRQAMELTNDWIEEGRSQGRVWGLHDGKVELVTNLIERRFGSLSAKQIDQIDRLSSEQLNLLGVALFDLQTQTDLDQWLSQSLPQ